MPAKSNRKSVSIPKGYHGGDASAARWYARRRHLAAAIDPVIGKPELRYMIEITDLEAAMAATFKRIYSRDGERVFKEAAKWFRDEVDGWMAATQVKSGRGVRRPIVPSITG
jgi:hypothetical protein